MSIKLNSVFDSRNDSWMIEVEGELDVSTAEKFKAELYRLEEEKQADMRINLSGLDYIDSTGLGVMVGVLKRLKVNNKGIYLNNPKSNVKKIFEITGLDKIFNLEG
ncbi:anti-sigma factor antagonist [Peptacetobacter hominis]|uniref:Anti-sigma factor antagonist n=1 Tax=Peptacetobacter hominis TaxID=2743610 RepID=A0A544QV70_9FIRM|nr:STAS domain-containing protein [Peptacetobacter hominis]TQQ84595.1 anti-sigma factor antagonist [Peptacetobacter hominis]